MLDDYYQLCDIVEDDVHLVAELIRNKYQDKVKLSRIVEDCYCHRLHKYSTILDELLNMSIKDLRELIRKTRKLKTNSLFEVVEKGDVN